MAVGRWLRGIGAAAAVAAVACGGFVTSGYALPAHVTAGVDATLPVPPERLFPLLVAPEGLVGSRPATLTDAVAHRSASFDVHFGTYVVHRTLTLTPVDGGTLVRWREEGTVGNPVGRWVVWVMGTGGAEEEFRGALRKLGEAAAARPEPTALALTFDDLPYQTAGRRGPTAPPERWDAVSRTILAHLKDADAPAAVFVNARWAPPELVATWRRTGATIGNHTASHLHVDRTPPDEWAADVRAAHEALGAVSWFRYPYLNQGRDQATAAAAEAALAAVGERNAPVTIPTVEWYLAQRYDESTDDAVRAELAAAFVETTREAFAAARDLGERAARARGRTEPVPHVLLLHVNDLEADHLPQLLVALAADGARFAPLEEVLADPLFAEPPGVMAGGRGWLGRLDPDAPDPFVAQEEAVTLRFPAVGQ